ncbi:MAG: hypothetical protein NC236_02680 [Mycoplasma sp.]|nr:hypothetical protein [Mycoplasma sp.]
MSSTKNRIYKEQVINFSYKKYEYIIKKMAILCKKRHTNLPLEVDDYINYFLMEFNDVTKKFNSKYNVKFETYLSYHSYYKMSSYAKKFMNKNNTLMNNMVSFNDVFYIAGENNHEIFNQEKINIEMPKMSFFEKNTFRIYFQKNNSIKQTSKILNKSESAVIAAIARIRKKFRANKTIQ